VVVYDFLNADYLLTDTCDWYAFTAETQDSSTLERTDTYAAAVTTPCMLVMPSRRWQVESMPVSNVIDTREIYLPAACTVAPQDKITHGGIAYRVISVANWQGFQSALLKRIEGVT
jgi:hypothetical protein